MRRFALSAAVLSLMLLGGCTSQSVVGKWKVSGVIAGTDAQNADITADFQSDKKFVFTVKTAQGGMNLIVSMNGAYEVADGKTLSMTADKVDFKIEGQEIPAQLKPMIEEQKKKSVEEFNQNGKGEIKWQGPDKFAVKMAENELVFTKM